MKRRTTQVSTSADNRSIYQGITGGAPRTRRSQEQRITTSRLHHNNPNPREHPARDHQQRRPIITRLYGETLSINTLIKGGYTNIWSVRVPYIYIYIWPIYTHIFNVFLFWFIAYDHKPYQAVTPETKVGK